MEGLDCWALGSSSKEMPSSSSTPSGLGTCPMQHALASLLQISILGWCSSWFWRAAAAFCQERLAVHSGTAAVCTAYLDKIVDASSGRNEVGNEGLQRSCKLDLFWLELGDQGQKLPEPFTDVQINVVCRVVSHACVSHSEARYTALKRVSQRSTVRCACLGARGLIHCSQPTASADQQGPAESVQQVRQRARRSWQEPCALVTGATVTRKRLQNAFLSLLHR